MGGMSATMPPGTCDCLLERGLSPRRGTRPVGAEPRGRAVSALSSAGGDACVPSSLPVTPGGFPVEQEGPERAAFPPGTMKFRGRRQTVGLGSLPVTRC